MCQVGPSAHGRPSGIVHAWVLFIKMLIAPCRMLSEVRNWISNRASGTAELRPDSLAEKSRSRKVSTVRHTQSAKRLDSC